MQSKKYEQLGKVIGYYIDDSVAIFPKCLGFLLLV